MDEDQQFCLRWNNHQNTLISVFDNFLESETLVDCTLAAEGQYLKAHKVVLMACSPYLETLLNQHHDKHPILIMKDVKFQELKAMLQYMYRGEVVISPDQIPTFLKAAESLQIKGLTGSDSGDSSRKKSSTLSQSQSLPRSAVPHSDVSSELKRSALQIIPQVIDNQPASPLHSGDGSISPILKKRRRTHKPSSLPDDYSMQTPRMYPDVYQDTSNSCDVPPVTVVHSTPVDGSNVPSAEPSSNLAKEIKTEDQSLSVTDEDGREQEDGNSSNGTGLDEDYRDVIGQAEPGTSGQGFTSVKEEMSLLSQDIPGLNQNQQGKELHFQQLLDPLYIRQETQQASFYNLFPILSASHFLCKNMRTDMYVVCFK